MTLAIFDLDNTLLSGDSDYLWGQFLAEQGILDGEEYERKNQEYYDQYHKGELDILEFLAFALKPLAQHSMQQLQAWHKQFMQSKIIPLRSAKAQALVDRHRDQGHTLMIITATNRFVTEPIADLFGIPFLLATEPEMMNDAYTGQVSGTPCFQEGKVVRLREWMKANKETLDDSWFYSDSHNDLPLLNLVTHPVAVNPDDQLLKVANANNWQILDLHN